MNAQAGAEIAAVADVGLVGEGDAPKNVYVVERGIGNSHDPHVQVKSGRVPEIGLPELG